jgi:hypothetical protein
MTRTAAASLVAAAIVAPGLAGCMSAPPANPPTVASNELPYHPGQGVVIAATQARPPLSAAAGGTVSAVRTASLANTAAPTIRLTVRMNDGTVQYVDTDDTEITVGSRVELGADRTIRKL